MILDTLNHLLGRGLSDIPIFFSALRSGHTECMVFLLLLCPLYCILVMHLSPWEHAVSALYRCVTASRDSRSFKTRAVGWVCASR